MKFSDILYENRDFQDDWMTNNTYSDFNKHLRYERLLSDAHSKIDRLLPFRGYEPTDFETYSNEINEIITLAITNGLSNKYVSELMDTAHQFTIDINKKIKLNEQYRDDFDTITKELIKRGIIKPHKFISGVIPNRDWVEETNKSIEYEIWLICKEFGINEIALKIYEERF
jgi:hypothetical protein